MSRRVPYRQTFLDVLAWAGVALFLLLAANDAASSSDGATGSQITPPLAADTVRDCPAAPILLPGRGRAPTQSGYRPLNDPSSPSAGEQPALFIPDAHRSAPLTLTAADVAPRSPAVMRQAAETLTHAY